MAETSDTSSNLILNKLDASSQLVSRRYKYFEKGDTSLSYTGTDKFFYFILEGKIKVSQINPETGKEQILYLLGAGDMFDVVRLLDGETNEHNYEVLEASKVIELPLQDVKQMMHLDPSFQEFFFPYVAKQLRSMEELAVDLSLFDVYQRTIRLFSRFVDRSSFDGKLRLINNLSHEELAAMIGSVRKVVNRTLQKLKQEGIIELSRKHIKIKSLQRLLDKL